jgi:hypothetical protein
MSNIKYRKAFIITNIEIIIIEIGCRFDHNCKIKCDVLVRISVQESNRSRNITNNKISKKLLFIAATLSVFRGCMVEEEVELALDIILKGPIRRPL